MSDYSKWFWDNCDELNKGTRFAHSLSERCWNHQQQKINELESKLKAINEYQKIIYDQMQEHSLNYELIFNKLEDIEDLSK